MHKPGPPHTKPLLHSARNGLDDAAQEALMKRLQAQIQEQTTPPQLLSAAGGVSLDAIVRQHAGRHGTDPRRVFVELCELMLLIGVKDLPLYARTDGESWHRLASGDSSLSEWIFQNTLTGAWLEDAPMIGVRTADAIVRLGHVVRPRFALPLAAADSKAAKRNTYTEQEKSDLVAEFVRLKELGLSDTGAAAQLMTKWPYIAPGRKVPSSRPGVLNNINRWKEPTEDESKAARASAFPRASRG